MVGGGGCHLCYNYQFSPLFLSKTGDQGDLQLLAYELGYHPLSIEHSVSFIGQFQITL